MVNQLRISYSIKVSLGDVGRMIHAVNQYMVTGLVLWRATQGHTLIPFLALHKPWIHVVDDAQITEALM